MKYQTVPASDKTGSTLWEADSNHEVDAQAWWDTMSPQLMSLLESAGYSADKQLQYARFMQQNIMPSLGPSPHASGGVPHFDSFCNDDFSPVELSWNIHSGKLTIRVGFEPIGRLAATSQDPFNALETEKVLTRLMAGNKQIDDVLWRHFGEDLSVPHEQAPAVVARMVPNEHMTVNTVSFDLSGEGEPVPKLYFYPIAKALSVEAHAGELVCSSIERLPLSVTPALGIIRDFIVESKAEYGNIVRMECLSFDAIKPDESRLKLYLRTPQTSLARLREIYTLGGRLNGNEIEAGLAIIGFFWSHVLGVKDSNADLPPSDHRTAGIIFNFEFRHGDPLPKPKAYVPTRHYGGTDLKVAQGLSRLFYHCGWHQLAKTYVGDVQRAL